MWFLPGFYRIVYPFFNIYIWVHLHETLVGIDILYINMYVWDSFVFYSGYRWVFAFFNFNGFICTISMKRISKTTDLHDIHARDIKDHRFAWYPCRGYQRPPICMISMPGISKTTDLHDIHAGNIKDHRFAWYPCRGYQRPPICMISMRGISKTTENVLIWWFGNNWFDDFES